ncbi:MAG: cysteine desulfurase NifS [Candidatus Gastranaerophilales bacterium]|nr:cysteine desulfurase NifS [Candidatus Gastranaerophilales bacterium]
MSDEKKLIYLDNNATTKVDEIVLEKMIPYFSKLYGNASSMYDLGAKSAQAIKAAREQMMGLFNANDPKEVFFTASGSESANMGIRGILAADTTKKHIITTKVEHPCVLNLYKKLEKQGYNVTYLNVNSEGALDLNELEEAVNEDTALVAVMAANNETGIIFPIEKISQIVKSKNPKTKIYVDAVQAAGKISIDAQKWNVDMIGVSGHKFHAPKGIGALYVKTGTLFVPLIEGGHQERGKRAGTENVPSIVGIGQAAEYALAGLADESTRVKDLRNKLETSILKTVFNARLNSSLVNRVPNTTNIGFEYVEGELILLHLGDKGICASSGSACTSGSLDPSHVLKAMGVPFTALHGSIRFSLSRFTTEAEIDYTIKVLPEIIEKLTKISPFQRELKELKDVKSGND